MDGRSVGRTRAVKDLSRWDSLNERQGAYLVAVYREDQREEAYQRSAFSRGGRAAPADQWRWILYGSSVVDESPLRMALETRDLVDGGTGSTFAALANKGLLLTRNSSMHVRVAGKVGEVEVLYVRMTRAGRAAVRVAISAGAVQSEEAIQDLPEGCLPGETRLPSGTLRASHWRALARASAAGDEGLAGKYGDYGGIGWQTWRRLEDYRDGPLVIEKETGPPRGAPSTPGPAYVLSITAAGRRLYETRLEEYRQRYPNIHAPHPQSRPAR